MIILIPVDINRLLEEKKKYNWPKPESCPNFTELKFIKGQKQGAKRLDGELNEIRGNSRMYKVRIHDPYFAIFMRFSPLLLASYKHLILYGLPFIDVVCENTFSRKG